MAGLEKENIEKMFLPEAVEPKGMFEPGLQYLIEQITEAREALDYYVEVMGTMDTHTTIVIRGSSSTLDAALEFLKQLQEYERGQAQATAV
jgi:hypothetical protein